MPRFVIVSRVVFARAGAGLALIALALLGAAPAVLKDNPTFAYILFGVVALFGVAAVVMAIINEVAFVSVRDDLGELYAEGRELLEQPITSQAMFDTWRLRVDEWYTGVTAVLKTKLSPAHAWLFKGEPLPMSFAWEGEWGVVGRPHYTMRNTLNLRLANLHQILDRYIATRS